MSDKQQILSDGFWPSQIRCREWQRRVTRDNNHHVKYDDETNTLSRTVYAMSTRTPVPPSSCDTVVPLVNRHGTTFRDDILVMTLMEKYIYVLLIMSVYYGINTVLVMLNLHLIMNMDYEISIGSWNVKGLAGSRPYLLDLLQVTDICVVVDHHLYQNQLYKLNDVSSNHDVYARSCRLLNEAYINEVMGYGGVAIMWNKNH